MTHSEYFLNKLRQVLLDFDNEASKKFMNNLFNYLNDVSSELFQMLKERDQWEHNAHLHYHDRLLM
jgi:hypothetical protein